MSDKIPLFWPNIPREDILKEIDDTLSTRWIGQGPKVDLFEKEFGKKFGYKYPLFVNSGTSALELVYHLIGLKEGDEVIVPVLNCTAGQTGLVRRGVKIVFADINKDDLNINYEDIKRKTTNRTRAIVVVNLGGLSYDSRIADYARDRSISLIVDAAQDHEPNAQIGDYVCYSFQAIKHITTCDGGMLCLNNETEYKRAKLLRWFGIDRDLKKEHDYQAWEKREMTFDIEEAGYKYQPTDIDACFGLAGLRHLDDTIKYRQELVMIYISLLPKDVTPVAGGSCWLMGILADRRDELAEYLRDNNIDVNMVHLRNDIFDVFKEYRSPCPNMDYIHDRYLYLPLNTKVTVKNVEYTCNKIREFYNGKRD